MSLNTKLTTTVYDKEDNEIIPVTIATAADNEDWVTIGQAGALIFLPKRLIADLREALEKHW